MPKYVNFTPEQLAIARSTNLAEFLERQGETLKRSGSEMEWKDGYQKITIRDNVWFHQYDRVGGDAIDFVRWYSRQVQNQELSFPEAVQKLLEFQGCAPAPAVDNRPAPARRQTAAPAVKAPAAKAPEAQRALELPPKNENCKRVFAYLCSRGISPEILSAFLRRGMIYESSMYHNAVFVGMNADGKPRHAHMRGATGRSHYRANAPGSDPRYSFHFNGRGNKLYLFEAPIDMLSYISMHPDNWQQHSYAAACGVSDHVMWSMLQSHPQLDTVCLCLDNDEAGQAAAQRHLQQLTERGIHAQILIPEHKDWNEDLMYLHTQQTSQESQEPQEEETAPCMPFLCL